MTIVDNILRIIGGISIIVSTILGLKKLIHHKQKIGIKIRKSRISGKNMSYTIWTEYIKDIMPNFEDFIKDKNLYLYNIELKNIGKLQIKYNDFYKGDRLGISNKIVFLYSSILPSTKDYIQAEIIKNNKDIEIKFDTIKPNDSIYLGIISMDDCLSYNDFKGKTESINNFEIIDSYTAEKFYMRFSLKNEYRIVKESILAIIKTNLFAVFVGISILLVVGRLCCVK